MNTESKVKRQQAKQQQKLKGRADRSLLSRYRCGQNSSIFAQQTSGASPKHETLNCEERNANGQVHTHFQQLRQQLRLRFTSSDSQGAALKLRFNSLVQGCTAGLHECN